MANDIYLNAVTGLTPSVQLYQGTTPVGSPFTMSEISSTGVYVADMPVGVPYGEYMVVIYTGTAKLGSGTILWDGQHEVLNTLGRMRGLDPSNPWTVTPHSDAAGDVVLVLSGDGVNTSTATRT